MILKSKWLSLWLHMETKLLCIYYTAFLFLVCEKYYLFHQQVIIDCPSDGCKVSDTCNNIFKNLSSTLISRNILEKKRE